MALSLSASQKSIEKILTNDKFIIPSYQRPYSWTKDQCLELWNDLVTFYESEKRDEGYFLGNIVFAKSDEIEELEVIDGQQRLITISLFLKALSFFDPQNDLIRDCLWHTNRRNKTDKTPRLKTVVFENKDNDLFIECLNLENKVINQMAKNSKFKTNLYFFIEQFEVFNQKDNIRDFSDFLLDKVYLLPIESVDKEQDNAREKALTIFETINNRGLDLSDADIFKAQLFNSALNNGRQEEFIQNWNLLEEYCNETLPATKKNDFRPLVDVFRIYMHILRGRDKNTKSEIALRQFFTNLPLKKRDDNETMEDLNHIIASVKFVNDAVEMAQNNGYSELAKWLQLLDLYSNLYPKYALYVYLFVNAKFDNYILISDSLKMEELTSFVKELVRYAYYIGSTTKVKDGIYSAIVKISNNEKYEFRLDEKQFKEESLAYFGQIKKGVTLLSMYLNNNQKLVDKTLYLDNLVTTTNYKIDQLWKDVEVYEYLDTLGNLYLTENKNITDKKMTATQKIYRLRDFLSSSPFDDLRNINAQSVWRIEDYKERQEMLKQRLKEFFLGKI